MCVAMLTILSYILTITLQRDVLEMTGHPVLYIHGILIFTYTNNMRLTLHIDHYNVGAVCNKLQPLGHIVGANATDHYMISPLQQGKANGSTNYINIHTKWSVYGCILHIILLNLCRNDGMLIPERGKKHVNPDINDQ